MYLIFDFIFTLKAIHLTGLSRGVKSAAFVLPFSNAEEEIRMFECISKMLERPQLFQETKVPFWNDKYISKQMLKAHLDPDFNGASRKLPFIELSVNWIKETIPPADYAALLDLGCGPGLYAERFARAGFQVTGVDFSEGSIDYARDSAKRSGLDIRYIYHDYLDLELNRCFDFITMIYCDYGALSERKRRTVMQTMYHHLKLGGRVLLDVFSMEKYKAFREGNTWELNPGGGFWREQGYVVLNRYSKFTEDVTLEQIAVLSERDTAVYYLWNQYFTMETLEREAVQCGFRVSGVYGDVAGRVYDGTGDTIAVLLEKL